MDSPYPDYALVDQIAHDAWRQRGWTYEKNGADHKNIAALREFVLDLVLSEHVVEEEDDKDSLSFTKGEIYRRTFPDGPGARRQPSSQEEELARDKLATRVWALTNVGYTGHIQKELALHGLVLCESKVARTRRSAERPHDVAPEAVIGRFATANPDLILRFYTSAQGAAFQRAAIKLERSLAMVTDRRPELLIPVARQLQTMVKSAVAQIAHGDVKVAAALQPGTGDETEVA